MSAAHGANTRTIAIEALNHILSNQAHADLTLDKIFAKQSEFNSLDRAFVFEIVYGTLRWVVTLDWILKQSMTRNFSDMDSRVAWALRIGAYQILHMDKVPHRSAVDSTVEAVKLAGVPYAASSTRPTAGFRCGWSRECRT